MSRRAVRTVAGVQTVVGLVLAARPDAATRVVGIRSPNVPPAWLVRVLGSRMTAQGGLQLLAPTSDLALLGVGVDATHAASMAAVAAISARYRRGAIVSGAIASAFAAALWSAQRAR